MMTQTDPVYSEGCHQSNSRTKHKREMHCILTPTVYIQFVSRPVAGENWGGPD